MSELTALRRLVDALIERVDLVDKPAIGEPFVLLKSKKEKDSMDVMTKLSEIKDLIVGLSKSDDAPVDEEKANAFLKKLDKVLALIAEAQAKLKDAVQSGAGFPYGYGYAGGKSEKEDADFVGKLKEAKAVVDEILKEVGKKKDEEKSEEEKKEEEEQKANQEEEQKKEGEEQKGDEGKSEDGSAQKGEEDMQKMEEKRKQLEAEIAKLQELTQKKQTELSEKQAQVSKALQLEEKIKELQKMQADGKPEDKLSFAGKIRPLFRR